MAVHQLDWNRAQTAMHSLYIEVWAQTAMHSFYIAAWAWFQSMHQLFVIWTRGPHVGLHSLNDPLIYEAIFYCFLNKGCL